MNEQILVPQTLLFVQSLALFPSQSCLSLMQRSGVSSGHAYSVSGSQVELLGGSGTVQWRSSEPSEQSSVLSHHKFSSRQRPLVHTFWPCRHLSFGQSASSLPSKLEKTKLRTKFSLVQYVFLIPVFVAVTLPGFADALCMVLALKLLEKLLWY